jgi:hypothetical protein
VAYDIEQLLRLWTDPLPEDASAAADAFRAVYTDPVSVNGTQLSAADLVERARALQATFDAPEREVLDVVESGSKVAVAFRLRGQQVGPPNTSAGVVPATGRVITLRVIDILTVTDGLISGIWMVGDELGALAAIDAVSLSPPPSG